MRFWIIFAGFVIADAIRPFGSDGAADSLMLAAMLIAAISGFVWDILELQAKMRSGR